MVVFNKKKIRFRRKNLCYFTKNNITFIDYKDVKLLKRFLNKSSEIIPRSFSGTKNKYQKYLSKAIKRARFIGLLDYSGQKPKNLFSDSINGDNLEKNYKTNINKELNSEFKKIDKKN